MSIKSVPLIVIAIVFGFIIYKFHTSAEAIFTETPGELVSYDTLQIDSLVSIDTFEIDTFKRDSL